MILPVENFGIYIPRIENRKENIDFDYEGDHQIAKYAAEESMVLLKNEDFILPLKKNARIAFIGKFADKPRYQGVAVPMLTALRLPLHLKQ